MKSLFFFLKKCKWIAPKSQRDTALIIYLPHRYITVLVVVPKLDIRYFPELTVWLCLKLPNFESMCHSGLVYKSVCWCQEVEELVGVGLSDHSLFRQLL